MESVPVVLRLVGPKVICALSSPPVPGLSGFATCPQQGKTIVRVGELLRHRSSYSKPRRVIPERGKFCRTSEAPRLRWPGTSSSRSHRGRNSRAIRANSGHRCLASSSPPRLPAWLKGWQGIPRRDQAWRSTSRLRSYRSHLPIAPPCLSVQPLRSASAATPSRSSPSPTASSRRDSLRCVPPAMPRR